MKTKFSYIFRLVCSKCGNVHDPATLQTYCFSCNAPLVADYDLEVVKNILKRDDVAARPSGMWRWHELLPINKPEFVITLGEGDTPLLPLPRLGKHLGMTGIMVKDESINPTGSFKARGLAAAISKAGELGVQRVIVPTAGNAGGAMAAYAARAGMQALVVMPADTPRANVLECRITGAMVELVDGLISDAAALVKERVKTEGWFDVSTFKEPYRLEGKKVMGFEICQQFNWDVPDVILYPTGGGTGLVGIHKAILELQELGWLKTKKMPRIVAVQSTGCAPVVRAFDTGQETCTFYEGARTLASGLRVPRSFADRMILQTIRKTNGTAVAVTDEEILTAQRLWAEKEGMFVAPEGAATLAGLIQLHDTGWIQAQDKVVLLNTATGLKYLDIL
mgnify:CR=1 FL=1